MTIFSLANCKKSQEGHRDQLLRLPLFELSGSRSAPDTAVFTVKHGETQGKTMGGTSVISADIQ